MPSRAVSLLALAALLAFTGCSAIPDVRSKPKFHNPFPQLQRVAVLPFVNQSQEPTLNTDRVTIAYHNELQKLPGFEVKPLGVVRTQLQALDIDFNEGTDFQALAQHLDVDVVVLGAVTEYTPYYPPRLAMRVHWYAANPGFHPIPPGYGLPWGTAEEEYIPDSIVHEAEFALAREQLKTQTPSYPKAPPPRVRRRPAMDRPPARTEEIPAPDTKPMGDAGEGAGEPLPGGEFQTTSYQAGGSDDAAAEELPPGEASIYPGAPGPQGSPQPYDAYPEPEPLPPDWPDPRGFIPESPQATRPKLLPQAEPIITHTAHYDGSDDEFTRRVSEYFYFRDDARFGGWQAYLQRSDDFINVCCHFHITETLAARGGAGKSRVVWRWPIDRYER